ncbi:MAG: helix-turn-helix domain-containing protein [Magnetococcales bacterium]|nr:helix-turn-helix domain-containing protein [Magnetococcales bacterium]
MNTTPRNTRQRILEIKLDPLTSGWSLAMIGKKLGVSRVTVHRHIKKLEAAGEL